VRRAAVALPLLLLAACGGPSGRSPTAPGGAGSALVPAAAAGDATQVRRLLAAGLDPDTRDARGRTAVTAAAAAGPPSPRRRPPSTSRRPAR